ncbi:MAG: DNA (cytosine-5-)-methyltransferase [Epsilonproteobacteria bacterium]|nr:MAG: DNA (cytosine-5-)-methyltransferase [Campylobacterota bacterium]
MKLKKPFKHIELFSGIGGFRTALDLIGKDLDLDVKCIGFSEIDKYATQSYKVNYNTENEKEIGDIVKFTSNKDNIKQLSDFDLLTGGFPCQPFSMMGKQKGFSDKRGEVFYSIIDILKIKQPKYLLLENVKNLYTHDDKKTYKEIKRSLEEDAGYIIFDDIFNTSDFKLPQHRRRIFIFGIRKELVNGNINFNAQDIKEYLHSNIQNISINKYKNVLDGILDKKDVEDKYYLSEKIKPTILSNGTKNFKSNSKINQLIARPLTATMVKMHRACQDNYYSDEFLNAKCSYKYLETEYSKDEEKNHKIRKLSPWEALKLQGFNKAFFDNASNIGISNHQLYKQSGNAVSVNTVYAIIYYLINNNIIKL